MSQTNIETKYYLEIIDFISEKDKNIVPDKISLREIKDELELAREALRREMLENTSGQIRKWRGLATMMSHFDICTSARISCNICAEARQAYVEALTNG